MSFSVYFAMVASRILNKEIHGGAKSNNYSETMVEMHAINSEVAGADPGGPRGPGPPRPPKMRPQHQNSTKLRPQNGSFRPVTTWAPP